MGVFVLVAGYFYVSPGTGNQMPTPITGELHALHQLLWWEGYLGILVVVAAGVAIHTRSIVRAMVLCFACGAGVGVHLGGVGVGGGGSLLFRFIWTFVLGGVTAVLVGGVSSIPAVLLGRIDYGKSSDDG